MMRLKDAQPGSCGRRCCRVRDAEATAAFLARDRIQYVLVPRNIESTDVLHDLSQLTKVEVALLARRGLASPVLRDARYVLWALNDALPACRQDP